MFRRVLPPLPARGEHRLQETIVQAFQEDITEGTLQCSRCGWVYPIQKGIAFLNLQQSKASRTLNRYETLPVLSSYLWSHYGDLLGDEQATDAYSRWTGNAPKLRCLPRHRLGSRTLFL
jgi:hypothetical protein